MNTVAVAAPAESPTMKIPVLLGFYEENGACGRIASYVPGIGFVASVTAEKDALKVTHVHAGRKMRTSPTWKPVVDDDFIREHCAKARTHKVVEIEITHVEDAKDRDVSGAKA